jgi:UDP-N-acetylglucosamine 2-epimerase (non-hydrolysing)
VARPARRIDAPTEDEPALILVVFGTTGELIKLMPVLGRLRDRKLPFVLASTGQQVTQIPRLLGLAGLQPVEVWLGRGRHGADLRTTSDIPGWAASVAFSYARHRSRLRSRLRRGSGKPLVLVHGDTMTTVGGAVMGRLLRVPVAHIESGLRSFDLLHPFPEELNRRVTTRLAHVLYAPGAWAASNLSRGDVVDTGSNTVRDALALVDSETAPGLDVPATPFGIASLHRFELLGDARLLELTIAALRADGRTFLWVDHPVTSAALEKHGLEHLFGETLVRIPRLDFFGFVALMRRSALLVTDSGGSQEETFYLDIPCLIHRKRTERREGLGENVVLSGFDLEAVRAFLRAPEVHRRRTELPAASPSDVIVDDLQRRGFAA